MLGNGQSLKRAIECPSGLCDKGLLQHEGEIHFPYPGHLVEEDKRALEKRVHFLVFSPIFGRIATTKMTRSEFEILQKSATDLNVSALVDGGKNEGAKKKYHLPQLVRSW